MGGMASDYCLDCILNGAVCTAWEFNEHTFINIREQIR